MKRSRSVEQFSRLAGRWRHERRRLEGRSRGTDPVLRRSKLARLTLPPSYAGENHGMHLADETDAYR